MVNTSTNTVVGYFSSHEKAQSAVDALKDAGFTASQIGLAARGTSAGAGRSSTSSTDSSYATTDSSSETSSTYSAREHESMWEKIKDFFEGHHESDKDRATDSYVSQPYDEFGPDDMRHSLAGLSVPEQRSRYFGHRFTNDQEGAVVTVSTEDRQDEAAAILQEYDGDLGKNADTYDYSTSAEQSQSGERLTESQNIRLYGEVLRVHKDRINRGEVRVRKEVRTDTQTVEVPVTREELVIERNPVSGEQAARDATFKDQEIRIPLTEERASVEKQPVVREEVRVGKREVTNVQSVDEQVRHEELNVDDTTKSA